MDPTSSPSISPSSSPSDSPSNNPMFTYSPSTAPTAAPTNSPSLSLSNSPTACIDYDQTYNSSDGTREKQSIPYIQLLFIDMDNITTDIQRFTGNHFDSDIECNAGNTSVCLIACHGKNDCNKANVDLSQQDDILVNETKHVYVVCNDTQSCANMVINIDYDQNIELDIQCKGLYSCEMMNVYIVTNNNDNSHLITANISCYVDNACKDLQIITDSSDNIIIYLHLYRYSSDIIIKYYYHENVHVLCGSINDRRFIRYDANDMPNSFEILELAREEYSSSNRLPCEDVNIICENTDILPHRECSYEYGLSHDFNLIDILDDGYNCCWLEIGELYVPSCKGTCGLSTDYIYILTW